MPKPDAAAAPGPLSIERLERALASWESDALTTLGPLMDTRTANAFTQLRANLRAVLAAAITE